MELAKITSKGQITIPIAIRKILNLKDGDKVIAFLLKKSKKKDNALSLKHYLIF